MKKERMMLGGLRVDWTYYEEHLHRWGTGVTQCLLSMSCTPRIGWAFCSKSDTFDYEKGAKVAFHRSLRTYFTKAERRTYWRLFLEEMRKRKGVGQTFVARPAPDEYRTTRTSTRPMPTVRLINSARALRATLTEFIEEVERP